MKDEWQLNVLTLTKLNGPRCEMGGADRGDRKQEENMGWNLLDVVTSLVPSATSLVHPNFKMLS